jgi:hypothetical protein
MKGKYQFKQFSSRPQDEAENEKVFALGPVLGIEVTVLALANRCIGNLDHHGPDSTVETPSACEQALTCKLPPDGTVLATIRPDADSVTAMAIFAALAEGKVVDAELVREIGAFDRLGPAAGRPDGRVIAIARKAMEFKTPLANRVEWIKLHITGETNGPEARALVEAHDRELAEARAASEISLEIFGKVAVVVSTHRYATTLGYESSPVVIAKNPAMPVDQRAPDKGVYVKYTVCRYDSHVPCDLPAVLRELQALESGWGGRDNIIGSPQGVSSTLTLKQVLEAVSHHLPFEWTSSTETCPECGGERTKKITCPHCGA